MNADAQYLRAEVARLRAQWAEEVTINADLLAALEQALRYIEVQYAYSGVMTAEQVEQRIKENATVAEVEIGANSANTLARFSFAKTRAVIARVKEKPKC